MRTRLSQSNGPSNRPTPPPRQRANSRFSSFLRRFKPHGASESDTQPRSHPLSWTRNIVSGMMRRPDGSDIQLQEVEVPYTAEELSREKEKTNYQFISTSQDSSHPATRWSNTEHSIIITAATSHCHCQFSHHYKSCRMACSFHGLALLHAY